MCLPCSNVDLIPQKGKMSFEQILIKAKMDDSESTAIIKEDHISLDDNNQLSNIALIEYINQLMAAVHGYNEKYNNKITRKCLFVGLQEAEFFQPVYAGDCLTLKGFVTEEVAPVTFIQGIIFRDGGKIAQFVTKLYEVEDGSEFDLLTNNGQVLYITT
jgi:predicted hotdog family 3-hydroxylacyl-ACP dehydratase